MKTLETINNQLYAIKLILTLHLCSYFASPVGSCRSFSRVCRAAPDGSYPSFYWPEITQNLKTIPYFDIFSNIYLNEWVSWDFVFNNLGCSSGCSSCTRYYNDRCSFSIPHMSYGKLGQNPTN